MKTFIFDAEVTGESLTNDMVLEIAFLEAIPSSSIYKPGRYYRRCIKHSRPPETPFALRHHVALYDECKHSEFATPSHVKDSITDFFKACGAEDPKDIMLVGSRLEGKKLYMMNYSRYLDTPRVEIFASGPVEFGDYGHVLDLHAFRTFFKDTNQWDDNAMAAHLGKMELEHQMPNGARHQALYDCFRYLKELNEYRMYIQTPWEMIKT